MAAKTYVPQLRIELKDVQKYSADYLVKLQLNLTPVQYNCLIAVIEAVNACLIALGEPEVNP